MKKISTLCLVLLSALASWAYDFKSGDLYYNIIGGSTVEVAVSPDKYSGLTSVEIPASVTYNQVEYAVTGIAANALSTKTLKSVHVGKNVTNIFL